MLEDTDKKKDEEEEPEPDPTGVKGYVINVVDNPDLEKDLKAIGSPYQIPSTPVPGKSDEEEK